MRVTLVTENLSICYTVTHRSHGGGRGLGPQALPPEPPPARLHSLPRPQRCKMARQGARRREGTVPRCPAPPRPPQTPGADHARRGRPLLRHRCRSVARAQAVCKNSPPPASAGAAQGTRGRTPVRLRSCVHRPRAGSTPCAWAPARPRPPRARFRVPACHGTHPRARRAPAPPAPPRAPHPVAPACRAPSAPLRAPPAAGGTPAPPRALPPVFSDCTSPGARRRRGRPGGGSSSLVAAARRRATPAPRRPRTAPAPRPRLRALGGRGGQGALRTCSGRRAMARRGPGPRAC